MNGKQVRIRKDVAVDYFKVGYYYSAIRLEG
jgi:hypothetical protein